MLRLPNVNTSLQAVLAGAIATTQPQATVSFSDDDAANATYTGGTTVTTLNGTTDVTICAAPATSIVRDIDFVSIFNRDTASITLSIKYDISATDSIIITVTLLTLETLQYVHGAGWACLDAQGRFKTSVNAFTGVLPVPNGGTGFGSYTIGDLLYADSASTLAKLADVATGNALISGGVGGTPTWGKIGLTTHISGTLAVANGGTGLSLGTSGGILGYTATGTLASSAALTANGIVIGGGAGATPTSTAAMTDGQLLVGQTSAGPLPKTISGDVTVSAAGAATIANDAVTNAKLANMANSTVKGRNTAGTGDPEDVTVAQLAAFFTLPTKQTFTSGSGTYTTPANVRWIRIRSVGGGGGGGGGGTGTPGNGAVGGNTTFSTLTAGGGAGGPNTVTGGFAGAAGGTASGGDINGSGGSSQSTIGNSTPIVFNSYGGTGGNSIFGAGGSAGSNGGGTGGVGTGFGAGGGGAGGTATATSSAPGGGGGGYCEKIINTPAATYSYAVGAAGAGGTAGTGGGAGGNGTGGFIIVEEFYV